MQFAQSAGTPSWASTEAVFWYDSNSGNKRIYFRDNTGPIPVPRLDRNESVTGQYAFNPASAQAPFTLNSNAQGQLVTGLNADLLDGFNSNTNPTANTIGLRDSNGRMAAADPVGLTDLVNLQYLNDALDFLTIDATQITSGLLALNRGGTAADLSGVATGGLIYKAASALAGTGALTGVLIGNGASAPSALAQLTLALGGTGAATAASARTNLDVLWADDVRGLVNTRSPRGGIVGTGSGTALTGTTGVNLGLNDFSIAVTLCLSDYTPTTECVLFGSHLGGNSRTAFSLLTTGQFLLYFINSGGTVSTVTFTLDAALVDGETYHIVIAVDRDNIATLYINGISDRDKNATVVSQSVSAHSTVNIGSGNANTWYGLQSMLGVCYGLAVFNYCLSAAQVLSFSNLGIVPYTDQWGSVTDYINASTLNGGFETAGGGGADAFGTWGETVAGTTTITRSTSEFNSGAASCRFTIDASNSVAQISQAATVGKRYRVSFYAKVDSTTGTPQLASDSMNQTPLFTLNTSWTLYSVEFVTVLPYIDIKRSNNCASKSIYIDDLTVTPLGAVLDVECDTADPVRTTAVKDRSSNNNHATALSGTYQIAAKRQLNAESILASGLTANNVLYAGTGGLLTGLGVNATATTKFLTQTSSGAPVWTDLFASTISWTGNHTFSGTVTVPTPSDNFHAATKAYVDGIAASGLRPLVSGECRVATTANITLSGTQTIDGVACIAGDRVLVKNQTAPAENGVYVVAAGAWSRSTDANISAEITKGAYTFVAFGSTNAGTSWYQTETVTTLGTDAVSWIKFFQQAAYVAGTGIGIAGQTISVDQSFSPTWTGVHVFKNASGLKLDPWSTGSGQTTEIRFYELAANGSGYIGFKAPNDVTGGGCIWVLPAADGAANHYLKTNGSATLSFGQIASTEISNSSFVTSVSGTTNRISVSGTLTPTIDISSAYAGQTSITTLGTVTTGVWSGTAITAPKGGTGKTSWSTGDIVYATGSTSLDGLSISGTTNHVLQSNGTTPAWSTYAMPASMAANQLLYGSSTTQVSALASTASRVLTTDGSGNLAWTNTLPTGLSVAGDASAKVVKLKWFNVGNGSSQTITLTHNFATFDVVVRVYENSSGDSYRSYDLVPTTRPTNNTVQLEFITAPTTNQFRACVMAEI